MQKEYLIFDLDWTLVKSMWNIVDTLINELMDYKWFDPEKAKYLFTATAWTPLKEVIKMNFENYTENEIDDITNKIYKKLLEHNSDFFEWVPEKIKELSKDYKLFLTTWNSTQSAENHLKKWNIYDLFEQVYWSDIVLKWADHLNIFNDYSWDDLFFKKAIYIWDWDWDRNYAQLFNIDFIRIWNQGEDKYEIESVTQIDEILNQFK